jgi:hypothetical protein|tara:strand:+ start:104 stop:541 length:438 start_codon:yes stop_codon:yes gene_type:complete
MILKQFAQEKELFMYVAEDATYATGNQAVFKASDFVGATTPSSTTTEFRFYPQDISKLGIGSDPAFDTFTLTHTEDAHIEVMKAVAGAMSNPHGGVVVIQDDLGTAFSSDGSSLGAAMTDLNYEPIASTGTAVSVSAVAITTVDA